MIMKSVLSSIIVVASLLAASEAQNSSQVPQKNAVTSYAVSSCGGAGISVSNFGIIYHRFTHSVEFSMIGTAKQNGLSPIMNMDVAAYGTKLPTQVIDLCKFASCPLSQNSTTIQGAQTLDQSYTDQIPAIFWTLPLDATVKLTFISTSDRSQLNCLTAKLANGITTKNAAIPWITGFVTVGLGVAAGVLGMVGGANIAATGATGDAAPAPVPDAESGLPPQSTGGMAGHHGGDHYGIKAAEDLDGNELGLDAILMMGGAAAAGGTGATLTAGNAGNTPGAPHTTAETTTPTGHSGPPAGRMDPITLFLHFQSISSTGLLSLSYPSVYHAFTANFAWANFILPLSSFRKAAAHMRKCDVNNGDANKSFAIPPVSSGSGLGASSGIATYSARLGVDEQDVFGIIYLVFLCACGVLLAISFLVGTVLHIASLVSTEVERKAVWRTRRHRWAQMSSNNTLRLLLLALGTLATFSFYQWTQKCTSGLTFFLSISALAFTLLTLSCPSFFILRISKGPDGLQKLFTKDSIYGRRWGSLYDTLNERQLYFAVALWVIVLIRSAITGFGQSNGLGQVVAMIVLQVVVCITLFKFQPYYSRGYNRVNYLLEGTKLVSHVLLLLFVDKLHINPIATTALGFVLLVINSLVALILVGLIILQLGWGRLWYRRKHVAFEKSPKIHQHV